MGIIKELEELAIHNIYVNHTLESLGSDEWEFGFEISYLRKEHQNLKRRATSFVYYDSFKVGGATYTGAWPTITQALIEGIKYAKEKILPLCQ